jgi:3-oxoacyl-[acyl-carrier-protein] synthase-3
VTTDTYVGIVGVGYALPASIRTNDDPIFAWLTQHAPQGANLFQGYRERRVLAPAETLMDIMTPAALRALDDAGLTGAAIDALIGYGSVSQYLVPNALAQLHHELDLPCTTWVLPINNEYSNFSAGLLLAHALVRANQAANVLVVCGGNWTRYVDYHTPPSISAGDGAGAAVVGRTADRSRFTLVDAEIETRSEYYGVMFMQPDMLPSVDPPGAGGVAPAYTQPLFHITPAGQEVFRTFGEQAPGELVNRLLARNGLSGSDITLISHQTSSVLNDAWAKAIEPAQYLASLDTFGNMTLAAVPVNLAFFYDQIERDHLVLLGMGADIHASALLLRRNR